MNSVKVFKKISELRTCLREVMLAGKSIGFVPTMGALHAGHLSLVAESVKHNDVTVVSIFVNPTQFGPNEDLAKYPRTLEADLALLSQYSCVVFFPEDREMIDGFDEFEFRPTRLSQILEGATRPGHFDGVCKIVLKLFNIVQADAAYFGEKDFQQLAIIRQMAEVFQVPIQVIGCPTVREADGLAMSSRNRYLTPSERRTAAQIFAILTQMARRSETAPDADDLISFGLNLFKAAPEIKVDYLTIVDSITLTPVMGLVSQNTRILFAGWVGTTRLIDNIS